MSPSQIVADLGEHALIARLRARAGAPPPHVTLGIGDDAATIAPARGEDVVLTTDSLVEDVHFRRGRTPAAAIGYKALAVNLSDLAAMGAMPRASLLSLALPRDLPIADFDALVDGFCGLAAESGAPLAGGNITRSPGPLVVDVTAVGSVRPRRVLTRASGRPGDELYLTNHVGAAATGLAIVERGLDRDGLDKLDGALAACVARFERPEPRLRCGVLAARSRCVRTAIDLSDGLADAVRQLADASGTGAVIEAARVPVHPGAIVWSTQEGRDPIGDALSGGEDYELLFAVSPRRRRGFLAAARRWTGTAVTRVGLLEAASGVWLERDGRREPLGAGFVHF
jgi:thiamine-monophosphate kinase